MRAALKIIIIVALLAGPAALADWYTGVGGNTARYARMDVQGPTGRDLLWEGSRPAIVSQQGCCEEDLLVVSRISSFDIPTGTWIVAHELETGAERWAVQLPYNFPDVSWRSRVSAIRDGQVYASRSGGYSNQDYLYALDPIDGSILWESAGLISESTTESLGFAPNGDLIVGNFTSVMRIDHTDGSTVWEVPRSTPTSNGAQAAIYGNRAYVWESSAGGPMVTAFDLEHGDRLFSSEALSPGWIQQICLFCGSQGTIYAPRSMNNPDTDFFVALADTGMGFKELWRVPMGYTPFAGFAEGPDGSVYTYSPMIEVLRLDPATGAEISRSTRLPYDSPASPRMAIDQTGTVYLTNGGFESGELLVFTPDLELIWSDPLTGNNLGGPVLAADGTLVVCGTGTTVRAYRSPTAAVVSTAGLRLLRPNAPNPFTTGTEIRFQLRAEDRVTLRVLDAEGRIVRHLLEGAFPIAQEVWWDGRDDQGRPAASGVYLASLRSGGRTEVHRMILSR